MSDCWDCQKKNGCSTLYLRGEQHNCIEKQQGYISLEHYTQWLAKSSWQNYYEGQRYKENRT